MSKKKLVLILVITPLFIFQSQLLLQHNNHSPKSWGARDLIVWLDWYFRLITTFPWGRVTLVACDTLHVVSKSESNIVCPKLIVSAFVGVSREIWHSVGDWNEWFPIHFLTSSCNGQFNLTSWDDKIPIHCFEWHT